MNIHKLARLTPFGREVLVQRVAADVPVAVGAREAGVSRQTVYKWCRRAADQTPEALHDRASTPHHSAQRIAAHLWLQIEKRRRQHWSCRRIAQCYDLPISTSSATPRPRSTESSNTSPAQRKSNHGPRLSKPLGLIPTLLYHSCGTDNRH
ncbi:leucine zipper domain-containing protein [Gemmatimonas sp. UBA7669]|uniref:leucine zipper domain-containing protein n=1 Tax=Gemmatimonas sp. UBA7669 TaxID=1946568 RepID=UPI0039C8878C